MIAHHIHDALAQVRRLQVLILEKRLFRGYSGIARMAGGLAVLAGALIMSAPGFPATPFAHLLGWGVVLVAGLAINYGALFYWFALIVAARGSPREFRPAFDAVPPLAVGAGLSLALILHGEYDLLFGTWMCLYGIAHLPYRHSLPFANYVIGLCYLLCGAIMLVWPGVSFTNPIPMGIVFGTGELIGGVVLYRVNREPFPEQEEEPSHESNA